MIICGDSLTVMPGIPDESVDLIVTDPPYGLHFMGKDWDKAVPSVAIWRECLRVLKPGAFAFVMSIPRMDCLSEMGKRLGEAGFETGFTPIFWAYASGFPKAMNMGKAVDKRNARRAQEYQALGEYLTAQRKARGLIQKDIARHFPSKTGGLTGCVWNWENAANVPTLQQWSTLKAALGLDSRFDELIDRTEAEREVIKERTMVQGGGNAYQLRVGERREVEANITAPATPEAQALDGSYAGWQPKPAVEVVIVAMKPLAHGTYIDQALDNRKGVTWLDDGRIPYEGSVPEIGKPSWGGPKKKLAFMGDGETVDRLPPNSQGRFPANLLVSDDVVDDGQGYGGHGGKKGPSKSEFWGLPGTQGGYPPGEGLAGFSRFFSLDSWWAEKLKELPESVRRTFPFLVVPKAGKKEKNLGCEGLPEKMGLQAHLEPLPNPHRKRRQKRHPKANYHPTVKPLKLMSYLITLGSRPGDVIGDFFAGTCTTAMAAKMLGRDWLMIEISEEWCRIGKRRVEATEARLV